MNKHISLVINCDTRQGFQSEQSSAEKMFEGCRSEDFIIDGVQNKIKFFDGFDIEVIVFIDEHESLPNHIFAKLLNIVDVLVVRKHTDEANFNDWNYIRALELATGDIVVHFDQDSAGFSRSKEDVQTFLDLLNEHDFISYPSHWSPFPVYDDSFDHTWVSTRFFMCKREALDFPEIIKCQKDYDYWCATYPVARKCHWTEHIIGSMAKYRGQKILYPPINIDSIAIFSWGSYTRGTLKTLNEMSYLEIRYWLNSHPIEYPNDIHV